MTLSGFVYRCSAGQTFDEVALEVYQDEKYASELFCANPQYSARRVFQGGEILALPAIQALDETLDSAMPATAPWKEL